MLTLQRASAGSGKTYTLTYQYIKLLLTVRNPESRKVRLRDPAEIPDAVGHILAVTFTNKATKEMKERILGKLDSLAYPDRLLRAGKKVDYLDDLIAETNARREDISRVAKIALKEVLNQYSHFNISTIDAFFQTILRTFAYEAELPDAYNLVIDTKYLARMAAEELVDDLATGRLSTSEAAWLRKLIMNEVENGKNSWSLFQRRESNSPFRKNLFSHLVAMGEELNKEEFKEIRDSIKDYFVPERNFYATCRDIDRKIRSSLAGKFRTVAEAALEVIAAYKAAARDPSTKVGKALRESGYGWEDLIFGKSGTAGKLKEILNLNPDGGELPELPGLKLPDSCGKFYSSGTAAFGETDAEVRRAVGKLKEACEGFMAEASGEDVEFWKIAMPGFPRIAIMHDLMRRISNFLIDNNAMQLADSNSILRKIVNGDDVSFIYERIGTRLHHYLIDEFQDTSRMQWEVLYPMLKESMANGFDNLIIGDAKQSIYRFRSAEPKLITSVVPKAFRGFDVVEKGYSEKENTNWRSDGNLVRFNNSFFSTLARHLDEKNNYEGERSLAALYGNAVQRPDRSAPTGYVRIEYVENPLSADNPQAENHNAGEKISAAMTDRIGSRIATLLERGYRQKDIAILVNTNSGGVEVIAGLMEYNRRNSDIMPVLKFVSEESLKLGKSRAVGKLIECFRMIRTGLEDTQQQPEDEFANRTADGNGTGKIQGKSARRINWAEIGHKFSYFLINKPDAELDSQLDAFLKEGVDFSRLDEIMRDMQAITLPSLAEAMIENFLSPELRSGEAPFLAAFMDSLLEYCANNIGDIGSFLKWWDNYGRNISISSPEGTEAINVMTIHSSKGLEFRCVIIPDIDINFKLRENWVWIPTPRGLSYSEEIPKYVAVEMKSPIYKRTTCKEYQEEYEDQLYMSDLDQLDKVYVAFTRAISELYVYFPTYEDNKGKTRLPAMTMELLKGDDEFLIGDANPDYAARKKDILYAEYPGGYGFEYGQPVDDVEGLTPRETNNPERRETRDIKEYFVNSHRGVLKYHPEGKHPAEDEADDDRGDPRSEGALLHTVLQNIIREEDIERAFGMMRAKGLMKKKDIDKGMPMIRRAVESVRERGWFDGSRRILAERPVFSRGREVKRPDRVMIDKEGRGVVVDYKFGGMKENPAYQRQVRNYMRLMLDSGLCNEVEGYLWYVRENHLEKVEFDNSGKNS